MRKVHTRDTGIEDNWIEISTVRPAYGPKFPVEKDFRKAFWLFERRKYPIELDQPRDINLTRHTVIKFDIKSMSSKGLYFYNIVQHAITPKESFSAAPCAAPISNYPRALSMQVAIPAQIKRSCTELFI